MCDCERCWEEEARYMRPEYVAITVLIIVKERPMRDQNHTPTQEDRTDYSLIYAGLYGLVTSSVLYGMYRLIKSC